jgi:hypothetical protein
MARVLAVVFSLFLFTSSAFAANPGQRAADDRPALADMQALDAIPASAPVEKQLADGLYMDGNWVYSYGNGSVSVTLDYIYNYRFSTTGTLRLSLWAVSSFAGRGVGFTGYRLATFSTFAPLASYYAYYDISRTASFLPPPNGTYWFVLALEEYSPAQCASSDGYCLVDSGVSSNTNTFGPSTTTLTVRLPGTGAGTVAIPASGLTCSAASCAYSVNLGGTVTLSASPASGSAFAGWTGACAANGTTTSCTLTMSQAGTAVAWFNAIPSPALVNQMVTHYYAALLRRGPDGPGLSFWDGEAQRVTQRGASVNELWYAMAMSFLSSTEYLAQGRNEADYVSDLYNTFFSRAPDSGGLTFWVGQIQGGVPREVVLASFMFSPEFAAFTSNMFGNVTARAETNVVVDFYRGVLSRLPDSGGLDFWVNQFRSAQCQGASSVTAQADAISGQFLGGQEYAQRFRTNPQFVGDLYNAFLRRGGDASGVQFWITQLNLGLKTREQVRQSFLASPEFTARVNAVTGQGCVN